MPSGAPAAGPLLALGTLSLACQGLTVALPCLPPPTATPHEGRDQVPGLQNTRPEAASKRTSSLQMRKLRPSPGRPCKLFLRGSLGHFLTLPCRGTSERSDTVNHQCSGRQKRKNLFAFLFDLMQRLGPGGREGVQWLHHRVESGGQGAPRLGFLPQSGNRAPGQRDRWPLLMHVLAVAMSVSPDGARWGQGGLREGAGAHVHSSSGETPRLA